MSIREDLLSAAYKAGGSLKTKANRRAIVKRFVNYLQENNIQIRTVKQIKTSHLTGYICANRDRGLSARTLQTEISALRVTLRAAGRKIVADNIRNDDLEISGASRAGTKCAMPDEMYKDLVLALDRIDPGVAICARLERTLGLRAKEAIMSTKSLVSWASMLQNNNRIRVIFGTKGGRPRDVMPFDSDAALDAIFAAIAYSKTHNNRLVDKPNLKAALSRYSRVMHKAGATGKYSGHALRYAFAGDQVAGYLEHGHTLDEALALTAMDLGHGDGRGRWIKQVYLQS